MEQGLGPSPLRVSSMMVAHPSTSQAETVHNSQESVQVAYFCNINQRVYGAPDAPSGAARQSAVKLPPTSLSAPDPSTLVKAFKLD